MKRYLTAVLILFFIAFMSAASEYIRNSKIIIHLPPDGTESLDKSDSSSSDSDTPSDSDESTDGTRPGGSGNYGHNQGNSSNEQNDNDPDQSGNNNNSNDGAPGNTSDPDGDPGTDENADPDDEDKSPGGNSGSGNDGEAINIENIFIISNAEKLTQTAKPTKNGDTKLTASLAKNESEGMQFIVRADRNITNAEITVSALTDSNGNKISDVKIYRQHYIQVTGGAALGSGKYPDALIPIYDGSDGGFDNSKSNIAANKNQGYWITVTTSKSQPAGTYSGKVTFSCD